MRSVVPRPAEVVTEENALEGLRPGAADAGPGADDQDEGDDGDRQQDAEHNAEVLLKVSLDPGNHERKGAS